MEMGDQYRIPDFRQLMAGRTHFPSIPPTTEPFYVHRNLATASHCEMITVGHQVSEVFPPGIGEFRSDSNTTTTTPTTSSASLCGFEIEGGCIGGDGGSSRWPRQETLTLLEIRSSLDSKFKEANQKGPLWDEVSRIMLEEHGYQRSGKKCREKFENLYKYYKKTKEGKAGRQDGKHYRFFRQLEALYGDNSNPVSISETHNFGHSLRFHATNNTATQVNQETLQAQKFCESLSLSNSSESDTSSSEDDDIAFMDNESTEKKKKMNDSQSLKRGRKSWKRKIRDFIDSQRKKMMETQEAWLEKMLTTLEHKEQERMSREEEWRKREASRFDQERKFWARERAWVEARDAALMEILHKIIGRELKASSPEEIVAPRDQEHGDNQNDNGSETLDNIINGNRWPEAEISSLIQLRTSMESRFIQSGCLQGALWEEISAKMACLGYDRSAPRCKEKWEININHYFRKAKECNKKRKENSSRNSPYLLHVESLYNNQGETYCGRDINEQKTETVGLKSNEDPSQSSSNVATVNDNCFRYLMPDGESLWENYGMKLNKGENQ